MIDALREHVTGQGRRFYRKNLGENVALFVNVLRKWSFSNGGARAGHTSWLQIAGELWPDVDVSDREGAKSKFASLHRWAKLAGEIGVLAIEPSKNKRGQNDGVLWRLTWVPPELHSRVDADVAQLAGPTVCGLRRRRETAAEREAGRIRPWDRRGGQKVAKRFEDPPRRRPKSDRDLFFGSRRFDNPIAQAPVPTGQGGLGEKQDVSRAPLAVHTTGSQDGAPPGSTGRSASGRTAVPLAETAATTQERHRRPQRDRSAELAEAMRAFEARFGRPSLPIKPPTFERWQRAARRGELYGGWGVPVPGLALRFLVDRIESWTGAEGANCWGNGLRPEKAKTSHFKRPAAPASIAYFVALLDDASKHWRHAYRHEHGLCRQPNLCRLNPWMDAAHDRRIRNTSKWVAYDREVEHVRRTLNDVGQGYAKSSSPPGATC